MRGLVRIGGAVVVGACIILGAFYLSSSTKPATGAVVAEAPKRGAIDIKDSNNNGIADWEENLQNKLFEQINAPTSTATFTGADPNAPYTPPTTLTGRFSEAFMQDYLTAKMRGEDLSDPTQFVSTAVKAIDANVQVKTHSPSEVTTTPTTDDSLRAYGNAVASIVQKYSINNKNEAKILQEALAANDREMLKELEPIRNVYAQILRDTLALTVPDSLTNEHVALLNAYEAILLDVTAMQVAFTDPIYSLARVRGYEDDSAALFMAYYGISQKLSANSIVYGTDEPGAFFSLFEPQ